STARRWSQVMPRNAILPMLGASIPGRLQTFARAKIGGKFCPAARAQSSRSLQAPVRGCLAAVYSPMLDKFLVEFDAQARGGGQIHMTVLQDGLGRYELPAKLAVEHFRRNVLEQGSGRAGCLEVTAHGRGYAGLPA